MSTKSRRSRRKMVGKPKEFFGPTESLDKRDEIWCYVLIKLFTSMLENPEEIERLLKPSKSTFDVNLEPAIQQLRAALFKRRTSQISFSSSTKTQPLMVNDSNIRPEQGTSSSEDTEDEDPPKWQSSSRRANIGQIQSVLESFMNSLATNC